MFKIPNDIIAKAEAATILREAKAAENNGEYTERQKYFIDNQETYLKVLSESYSPYLARRAVALSTAEERVWRNEYYSFCIRFNEIVDSMAERVLASTFQRAVGYYTHVDSEDPEKGLVSDAMGNPIVSGGNDKLAMRILEAAYPEDFGNKAKAAGTISNPFIVTMTDAESNTDSPAD